jgi:hypothetical protein
MLWFGGDAEVLADGDLEFDERAVSTFAVQAVVSELTNQPAPQTAWQTTIPGEYAYRAFRIPSLYPALRR